MKAHIKEVKQKATKTVNALSCLGSSTCGVGLTDMRKIYNGTALPQIMYACSIWTNASKKGEAYTEKTVDILQSIQARAARAICGAFKATSRAALNVEPFLLPIKQQIWKYNADVVTQLLSCKDIAKTAGFQSYTMKPATAAKSCRKHFISWHRTYNEIKDKGCQWQRGPEIHVDKTAEKTQH